MASVPPQFPGAPWGELLCGQGPPASSKSSRHGRAWPGATRAWTPTGPRSGGFARAVCRGAGRSCTPWSLACARCAASCRAGSGVRSWGTAACAGCEGHCQVNPEGSGQPRHTPAAELHRGEVGDGCAALALGQAWVLCGGTMESRQAPAPRRVSGNKNEPGPGRDGWTCGVWAGLVCRSPGTRQLQWHSPCPGPHPSCRSRRSHGGWRGLTRRLTQQKPASVHCRLGLLGGGRARRPPVLSMELSARGWRWDRGDGCLSSG